MRLNVTAALIHIFLGCYHVFTDICEENGVEFTQYTVSLKVRFRLPEYYLSIRTERDITNTTDMILRYFHMSSVCMKRLMQTGVIRETFQVFAMLLKAQVFWLVTPCLWVSSSQRLEVS
jgi:hypothetical protein